LQESDFSRNHVRSKVLKTDFSALLKLTPEFRLLAKLAKSHRLSVSLLARKPSTLKQSPEPSVNAADLTGDWHATSTRCQYHRDGAKGIFAIRVPKSKDPSQKVQAAIVQLLQDEEAKQRRPRLLK
jgi:hypothetical protein